MKSRTEMLYILKPLIDEKRYKHSISTEKTAVKLAKIHGGNVKKAAVTGLIHDCAKNIMDDPDKFAKQYNLEQYLHLYEGYPACVLHAPMGAHLATELFGVNDPEILSAISCHTTGKANMSLLDKIVFLADYTEPTRMLNEAIEVVRKESERNLDKALYLALDYSVKKIEGRGNTVHKDTFEAYEYIKNQIKGE